MIDCQDIALITCIDINKKVVIENNNFAYRFFEQEAIRCYSSIRQYGGWLKDINIYCLNSKGVKLSKSTMQKFKNLNIIYIEDYNNFITNSKIEFIDKLYAQQFLEKSLLVHENYLLYLDLDVFLLREFPKLLFNYAENGKILLARHDKVNQTFDKDFLYRYNNVTTILNGNCYNAYFVLENKHNNFFKTLYDLILSPKYKKFYDDIILLHEPGKKNDYYLFEETLYDYQWYLKIFNDKIININISEIENVYFKHQHLVFKDMINFI